MPLTKFQALVARLSMAEVYPTSGEYEGVAATLLQIGRTGPRIGSALVATGQYGATNVWLKLSELEPSLNLLRLIEKGTYNQAKMQWSSFIGGEQITESLGKPIPYEPNDRRMCGICGTWMSHDEWIDHSHGMDK